MPFHRQPPSARGRAWYRPFALVAGGLVVALGGTSVSLLPSVAAPAQAATAGAGVVLTNPSFESRLLGDGGLAGVPTGWKGGSYTFNPSSAWYSGLKGQTTIGTMSGQNVALLYGGAPPLQQTTTTGVVPGTTYTAVVAVGGRTTTEKFSGVKLELLVADAVVASTTRSKQPVAGSFADVALTWTAPATAAGPVGVRISTLRLPGGVYLDVDNVRIHTGTPPVIAIPVSITTPMARQVVQRGASGLADVSVAGTAPWATAAEARLLVRPGMTGVATPWSTLTVDPVTGAFTGRVPAVRAGWYDLEVRATRDTVGLGTSTVQRVGVGEVFIASGQSNSANWGGTRQTPGDDRVSALTAGLTGWQFAADPQPNADASKGSPWPAFGTRFATTTGIPVAIVSVGVGATTVQQWQPGGTLYPRISAAIKALGPNGFRAVLWHQGEWDALNCTPTATYVSRLRSIVDATRKDAGFTVPWGIATVSRLPGLSTACMTGVDAAQAQVVATTPATFTGPTTNGYLAAGLTSDNIHFNAAGLTMHGNAWADAVAVWGGVPAA